MRLIAVLALGLVSALAIAWWRATRETGRLRDRLGIAASDLEHLQEAFSRFAPRQLVDRIASRHAATAETKDVTVLFADLVGFTQLGERLDPEALVHLLNEHFQRMSRVVSDHRGHVGKFIGDGLLVLFGAHEPNPWQANDAAHAALAMQAALEEHNHARAAAGGSRLRLGIGIHRGPVVAGVIGSAELQEFTVIGGVVNLASRVERLTRQVDAPILLTPEVRAHLDPRFEVTALPPLAVRGVEMPVALFRLDGFAAA